MAETETPNRPSEASAALTPPAPAGTPPPSPIRPDPTVPLSSDPQEMMRALRVSEARYRGLFDNMRAGVAVYVALADGADFAISDVNRAVERIERVQRGAIIGRSIIEVFPGVREFGLFAVLQRVWRTGEPEYLPLGLYHDGRIAGWRENYVYRLPNGEVVAVYEDATERVRAEQALRASEEKYRSLFESANDAIFVAEADTGTIVDVNPAGERLVGRTRAELVGQPNTLLHPPAEDAGYRERFRTRAAAGREQSAPGFARHADGRDIPISITASAFEWEGRRLMQGTFHDMTLHMEAEARIRQLNAELERRVEERTHALVAVNSELEAFAYSVSHDLRAPLRAIDGFGQALEESQGDRLDDDGRHYLARVRAATQRMGRLISDLLRLSRFTRQAMAPEEISLDTLARQVIAELREHEPQRLVEFVCEGRLQASADPHLMRIVLENLLSNAWKFTARSARPRIEFGPYATAEPDEVAYCVRDNGVGFDMAYAHKLFGAFQRLHAQTEFEGTGIGLAIVQRIIRRHGGRVWAESTPNGGAAFYFTLPTGPASSATPPAAG